MSWTAACVVGLPQLEHQFSLLTEPRIGPAFTSFARDVMSQNTDGVGQATIIMSARTISLNMPHTGPRYRRYTSRRAMNPRRYHTQPHHVEPLHPTHNTIIHSTTTPNTQHHHTTTHTPPTTPTTNHPLHNPQPAIKQSRTHLLIPP